MNNFEELASETLEKNDLVFAEESCKQWLSEFEVLKDRNLYKRNLYMSFRRTYLLLLDSQNGDLKERKVYPSILSKRPSNEYYSKLLELYRQYLISECMSDATISIAMSVVSIFFIYLESIEIDNLNNLTPTNVSNFLVQDMFSKKKPVSVQKYAYILKKLLIFWEENDVVRNKYLHLAIPRVFSKEVSIVTTISLRAEQHLTSTDKLSEQLGVRNQAIILLALRLGMRSSDIVNLKLSNIDWRNDTFICQLMHKK